MEWCKTLSARGKAKESVKNFQNEQVTEGETPPPWSLEAAIAGQPLPLLRKVVPLFPNENLLQQSFGRESIE